VTQDFYSWSTITLHCCRFGYILWSRVIHKWIVGAYFVDNCLVSLETTRCSSVHSMSFYFDSETGQCAEITHGCSSSENAFASLQSCSQECSEHLAISTNDTAARGLADIDLWSIFKLENNKFSNTVNACKSG